MNKEAWRLIAEKIKTAGSAIYNEYAEPEKIKKELKIPTTDDQ